MTDEFLTKGLQSDRYLKALRLIDQFEDEIEATLLELDQRMIDEHPDLFDQSTDSDVRSRQSPSNGLAFSRLNRSMNGSRAPESDKTQKLNIHLYWMPPREYGRTDVDGALRAFGYKIKYANQDIDDRIAERTRAGDWSLETSGNPYDSSTVFYRHVSSTAEIKETAKNLVRHFSEFGNEYASTRDEQS